MQGVRNYGEICGIAGRIRMARDIDISDRIANGWVRARFTMEVQGNDVTLIKESLEAMLGRLRTESNTIIIEEKQDSSVEIEPNWHSLNVEVDLLAKGAGRLIQLAAAYPPSALEIIEPMEISVNAYDLQSALLDVASLVNTFSNALYLQQKGQDESKRKAYEKFKAITSANIL